MSCDNLYRMLHPSTIRAATNGAAIGLALGSVGALLLWGASVGIHILKSDGSFAETLNFIDSNAAISLFMAACLIVSSGYFRATADALDAIEKRSASKPKRPLLWLFLPPFVSGMLIALCAIPFLSHEKNLGLRSMVGNIPAPVFILLGGVSTLLWGPLCFAILKILDEERARKAGRTKTTGAN